MARKIGETRAHGKPVTVGGGARPAGLRAPLSTAKAAHGASDG